MDGFFSEQPCYRIEILEWINEEDITDEWRYIWKHDPPEPVYAQTMMLTMKRTRTRELELRPSGYLNLRFFHGCGGSSRGAHADGTITQLLPEIGTK